MENNKINSNNLFEIAQKYCDNLIKYLEILDLYYEELLHLKWMKK